MKKIDVIKFLMATVISFFLIGSAFGQDALNVAPNGNVGIGTISPTGKLEIQNGDDASGSRIRLNNQDIKIVDRYNNLDYTAKIWAQWPGYGILNFGINNGPGSDVTTPILSIRGSGKLGIGTSDPQQLLHIHNSNSGGVASYAHFTDGDTGSTAYDGLDVGVWSYYAYVWNRENTCLVFGANNTERMRINANGNVGIGTNSPSYGLHVYEDNSDVAVYARNEQASGLCVALEGLAYGAGTNYGIYTQAYGGTTNYAGYFNGNVYGTANASFASFTDRTTFYKGDALSEIAKISGKDGEIDHSTLPAFAHVKQDVPVFEETELEEITPEDAFEIVMIEQDKIVETTDDNGKVVETKIEIGAKTESKGYKLEDGKIVEVVYKIPVYETEAVATKQLRNDVYFDERTGKVYEKTGDGQIFEKDGKVYQNNQTGTKVEEQRDIGAMVSILTVAVQQLDKANKELRERIAVLESKLK
jgi:hypothetical protein